jgi:hypothetical protein
MNNIYAVPLPYSLSVTSRGIYVNDYAPRRTDPKLDALVRSGDYFITLGTTLDTIAAELPETSVTASSLALAKLASELDYIQRHYHIIKKSHPDALTELW